MKAGQVITEMQALAYQEKALHLQKFFKTGKGQYAEGDVFLGIVVPETRRMAKKYKELPIEELVFLLESPFHEIRLCGLLILVAQYKAADEQQQASIVRFYLSQTAAINNWDLVDLSTPYILGEYLLKHTSERDLLLQLSKSENLWERRIAIVSLLTFVRNQDYPFAIELIASLKADSHDLIHKAMGWVLREMGKNDRNLLSQFLTTHATTLPRTTLRYAIEHYPEEERLGFLHKKE